MPEPTTVDTRPLWKRWIRALVRLLDRIAPPDPPPPPKPPLPPPPPPPSPPPPGRITTRRDLSPALCVGAQGGVFQFGVHVGLTWTSVGVTELELETEIGQRTSFIRNQVREYARDLGGTHPPHHVAQMQIDLNESLRQAFGPFKVGHGSVACRARARVVPDDRLRDDLAAHAEQLMKVENDHELRTQRTKLTQGLAEEWLTMLDLLREHPMTAHANRLTDKDFADVIDAMGEDRAANTERLIWLLRWF